MTATRKIVLGVAAALSLGLAAASASAQPFGYGGGNGPCAGGFGGPGYGMRGYGPMMGRGFGPGYGRGASYGDPTAAVEGRLAALKSELKIGAQQENAWNGYAQALKDQAKSMQTWHNERFASGSALERSDAFTKHLRERQQSADQVNSAFKQLYGALSPEQKAIADQGAGFPMAGGYGRGYGRGPGMWSR